MKYYEPRAYYNCIDAYKDTDASWKACPKCQAKPKIWEFDNGRYAICCCWETKYDRLFIRAKSAITCYKKGIPYDPDELKDNWNHWAETGEIIETRGIL